VCDQSGRKPFPTDKLLEQHLRYAHGRQLCATCTPLGRRFTLEYEAFTDAGLKEHRTKEHPRWAERVGRCWRCRALPGAAALLAHALQHALSP
jgi:hypothetical protein